MGKRWNRWPEFTKMYSECHDSTKVTNIFQIANLGNENVEAKIILLNR